MSRRGDKYSDAEKAAYWRKKALEGLSNSSSKDYSGGTNYKKSSGKKSKKSGAKFTRYVNKDGVEMYLTTGWRLNRSRELISIKATITKDSKESDKGWFGSVAVVFTNTITGQTNFHWGTMEKKTGKVVVNDMAFVMNPRAKNGGYAGTFIDNSDK
ncbi:hypothetical protein [Soonwooa purpurea]